MGAVADARARRRTSVVNLAGRFVARVREGPFDLGEDDYEAWTRTGGAAHRRFIGRVGAHLAFVIGVWVSLIALVSPATNRSSAVLLSGCAFAAGIVLMRLAGRVPVRVLDAMAISATLGLAIAGRHGGGIAAVLPGMYVVLGTVEFALRRWTVGLVNTVAIGISFAIVVGTSSGYPAPVTRWLAVMAAVLTSGIFVRWLVRNVRDLVVAEHDARESAEQASMELIEVSRAKSQFLARMSHELRTPLNAIVGFSDVLRDQLVGPLSPRQLEYVTDISESGRHLVALVDDVLDLSKVESGSMSLDLVALDLRRAVDDAHTMVRERAARQGIRLTARVDADVPSIDADGRKIRQVLVNLVANAVKFTPRGGRVTTHVSLAGDFVRVAVTDTGVGISPDDHERIFEQFEQVSGVGEGTGLGLPLARRLIELHGGRMWVESTPRQGSTFLFDLPARPPAASVARPAPSVDDELDVGKYARFIAPNSAESRDTFTRMGLAYGMVAAGLAAVMAVVTPGDVEVRGAVGVVGVLGLAVAFGLRRFYRTVSPYSMQAVPVMGVLAITVLAAITGDFAQYVALAYGWVTLSSFTLWDPSRHRLLVLVLLLIGGGYGAVVMAQGGALQAPRWLALVLHLLINGMLVRWVVSKLLRLVLSESESRRTAEHVRAELAATSQHKSDFLASMSHELRTPLNAIIGFSEVLRDGVAGPLNERQADYIDDILDAGRHLLALINDILDLARIEAGQMALHREPLVVAALVERAVAVNAPVAEERGVTVAIDQRDADAIVDGDHARLEQVVVNLLANAVKFTPDGGQVRVETATVDGELRLSVHDTGIGIHPAQRRAIFEAFSQGSGLAETTREGTGLGLALAKGLVELHGGRIWVESEPEIGSTFTVALPAGAGLDVLGRTTVEA